MRVLFICKKKNIYGFKGGYSKGTSGLYNSTQFIVQGLINKGVDAKIVEVTDNNDIDREVAAYKPNQVVIEALWVVPEKFEILKKLHPRVQWLVHLHSHMPFLAMEGIAIRWIMLYAALGIKLIANSLECHAALKCIIEDKAVVYLPNVYLGQPRRADAVDKHHIDIGCFGAIRPLKNQLLQAVAAIEFARQMKKPLRFHINASRVETNGDPVLRNIRELFKAYGTRAELVEHKWFTPSDFIDYLQEHIDIGMQVSLTETFNVVTADYVTAGIPVVSSDQVKWVSSLCLAEADSVRSVVNKMHRVWRNSSLIRRNQTLLMDFSKKSQGVWYEFCKQHADRCPSE